MKTHAELTSSLHPVYNWLFKDEADRLNCRVGEEDLYKVAFQTNDSSWWVLRSCNPVQWYCLARDCKSSFSVLKFKSLEDEVLNSGEKDLLKISLPETPALALVSWELRSNSRTGARHYVEVSVADRVVGQCRYKWGLFNEYESGLYSTLLSKEDKSLLVRHKLVDHATVTLRKVKVLLLGFDM